MSVTVGQQSSTVTVVDDGTIDVVTVGPAPIDVITVGVPGPPGAGTGAVAAPLALNVVIDGGGVAITPGVKADLSVPVAGTITAVRLLADVAGSLVLDLWRDAYGAYPPTAADSICGSAKPTLANATKAEDTTLSGWSRAVAAGDILRVSVLSVATIGRLTLALTLVRA